MENKKNPAKKKRKKIEIFVFDSQVMNLFNVEIKNGNNYEYNENNKIIYPGNEPYIRIKNKDLKKYRNLIAEENIVEYQYVPDIKEKKKLDLVYIKKRIKPYQFKSRNLIESSSKVKQVYENFNKECEVPPEETNLILNTSINLNIDINNNISSINAKLKNLVKTVNPLKKSDVRTIKIIGDGNCYYRCVSYFFVRDRNVF